MVFFEIVLSIVGYNMETIRLLEHQRIGKFVRPYGIRCAREDAHSVNDQASHRL
jgi:hypothetical protein